MHNEKRQVYKKHGHNLQQVSTVVQSKHYQSSISTSGLRKWQGIRHTVSQLFDVQSAHLLTAALPEAAVGQIFLYGFVSHMFSASPP